MPSVSVSPAAGPPTFFDSSLMILAFCRYTNLASIAGRSCPSARALPISKYCCARGLRPHWRNSVSTTTRCSAWITGASCLWPHITVLLLAGSIPSFAQIYPHLLSSALSQHQGTRHGEHAGCSVSFCEADTFHVSICSPPFSVLVLSAIQKILVAFGVKLLLLI